METLSYLLIPLGFTILIEVVIAFFLRIRSWHNFFIIILTQVLTNPIVNIGVFFILIFNNAYLYGLYLFIIETIVLFFESFIYKHCLKNTKISPFLISAFCNLSSFGIGVIYNLMHHILTY